MSEPLTTTACPNCDYSDHLHERDWVPVDDPSIGAVSADERPSERWTCYRCGATFAEPIERPHKNPWVHGD